MPYLNLKKKQWFFQTGPTISRDSQGILLFSTFSWKHFPRAAPITPQSHFYEMPLPLNSWEATRCRTPSSKPRHYLEEPSCPEPPKPQLVAKTFSMNCLNLEKQWFFQTVPNILRDSQGILLLSRFSWKNFPHSAPITPQSHFYEPNWNKHFQGFPGNTSLLISPLGLGFPGNTFLSPHHPPIPLL